jgi:hypothetical protein
MRTTTVRDLAPGDTIRVSSISTGLLTHSGRTVHSVKTTTHKWGESTDLVFTDGVTATGVDPTHVVVVES